MGCLILHLYPDGQRVFLQKWDAPIAAGDVAIAPIGCVHGVVNSGDEPLIFISVVSSADVGYQLVFLEDSLALLA